MPVLTMKNVEKYYGRCCVLNGISIDVKEGIFFTLLGRSGSGKTTILRSIAGLEKINSGKIFLDNKLVNDGKSLLVSPSERGIGFVFQDLSLWPHLTVYENIAFGLRIRKRKDIDSIIRDVLDTTGIASYSKKYPGQLSGGQQQLVALARSLVLNPRILLMDEPLANLDVKLRAKIREQIKILKEIFKVTIIYVTHDHREAFQLADEIAVLNEGKIVHRGTPDEIINSEDKFVREFIEF